MFGFYALTVIDLGQVLFGVLLMCFAAAVTLTAILRRATFLYQPLLVALLVIEAIFIALFTLDIFGYTNTYYLFESMTELSEVLMIHRWLLFQLPLLLVANAFFILLAYKERLFEKHARSYRIVFYLSILCAFVATLSIAIESMM